MSGASVNRQGVILIVVLGMITIFLALLLVVTARVLALSKASVVGQQQAQAFIMLQAAKIYLTALPAPLPLSFTLGDEISGIPNRLVTDRLGWCRISGSSPWEIVATGGASTRGGVRKNQITDGDAMANAYEQRWNFRITGSPPNLLVETRPVSAAYPW